MSLTPHALRLCRIMDLIGCTRDEASRIELAARLINGHTELRTMEDLTEAEFAALVAKAVALNDEVRRRIGAAREARS
jgi:hypothetical protein